MMGKVKKIIRWINDCFKDDIDYDDTEDEIKYTIMENKNSTLNSIIPIAVTILIAFFGNYMITTNKVSATDAKVEMYQQQIGSLSQKMDQVVNGQAIMNSQLATVMEALKHKKDK